MARPSVVTLNASGTEREETKMILEKAGFTCSFTKHGDVACRRNGDHIMLLRRNLND